MFKSNIFSIQLTKLSHCIPISKCMCWICEHYPYRSFRDFDEKGNFFLPLSSDRKEYFNYDLTYDMTNSILKPFTSLASMYFKRMLDINFSNDTFNQLKTSMMDKVIWNLLVCDSTPRKTVTQIK